MTVTQVNFVTGNSNKLAEVKSILEPTLKVSSISVDIEETQGTVEEITTRKTQKAAELVGGPVLVEDTALGFNVLNGLPGPYIKHFQLSIGHSGLNNMLAAYPDKSAEAICTFGYCEGPGLPVKLFQGRCPGNIVPARGPTTFGWDAVFEFEGKTFAEMDPSEKNKISHRGRALAKLQEWFSSESSLAKTM